MDELTHKELLERVPPGTRVVVKDFETVDRQGTTRVQTPEIELHCNQCNGERFFAPTEVGTFIGKREPTDTFLVYLCRNCRKSRNSNLHYKQN